MKTIRWIFFGKLDVGLERFVTLCSLGIVVIAYFGGYNAGVFVRYLPHPVHTLTWISSIVGGVTLLVFIVQLRFSFIPAFSVGLGAFCLFWVGAGLEHPFGMIVLPIALWLIVRGFSVGPAHIVGD